MDKKAQLAGAPNQILTFVILCIIIAVGGMVLGAIRTSTSTDATGVNDSAAANATAKGLEGIGQFSTFLPTIAIVLVAALLIAIVVGAFVIFGRQ